MAYRAARRMTVMGTVYEAGDVIPLAAIPPKSIATLVGMRRIIEIADDVSSEVIPIMRRPRGRPKGSGKKQRLAALGAEG